MGIFSRTRSREADDRLISAISALEARCARIEARLETHAQTSASAGASISAEKMLAEVGRAYSQCMSVQSNLLGRLTEQAARRLFSETARGMGQASAESRARKKAEAEEAELQAKREAEEQAIAAIKEACETCASKLEGREPRHNNDLIRHATDGHDKVLAPLLAAKPGEQLSWMN